MFVLCIIVSLCDIIMLFKETVQRCLNNGISKTHNIYELIQECLFFSQFLKFMNHKKSRLTDLFRKMDKNNDGLIPREDFIDGIMKTSKKRSLFLRICII